MHKLTHDQIAEQRLTPQQALAAGRHPVTGVLENVRSLYNVGSCFRTADAMLLHQLVLTGYTPAPPRPEIEKTALGATESVPWRHVPDPVQAVLQLKQQGVRVYALEIAEGGISLDQLADLAGPVAFVAGNEITGVSAETLGQCHGALYIPMYGVKHSLNVAVAFGIAAWHLTQAVQNRK